jgi:hypothetical protein
MSMSALIKCLFGLILIVCIPAKSALAAQISSWVSSTTGNDANNCSFAAPCKNLDQALSQTTAGGTVSVKDPGDYNDVIITKSVTIVNDSGGTVTICCGVNDVSGLSSSVAVLAGANDVVTLRGLTFTNTGGSQQVGVQVFNAHRVNIDHCTFLATTSTGIVVTPNTEIQPITLSPTFNLNIQDTTIYNSTGGGIQVTSVPGVSVLITVDRSQLKNNTGGGIKIDGSGGGPITVAISDSTISLNGGNGVNAVSSSANVMVNLLRDVIASNGLARVQANGATAAVLVNGTALLNNASALSALNGGRILTYGNNSIVGTPGSGFTGTVSMQ